MIGQKKERNHGGYKLERYICRLFLYFHNIFFVILTAFLYAPDQSFFPAVGYCFLQKYIPLFTSITQLHH